MKSLAPCSMNFSLGTRASSSFPQLFLPSCFLSPPLPNAWDQEGLSRWLSRPHVPYPQDLCYHLLYDWPPGHHLLGRIPLWNSWKPHALRSSLSVSSYEPWQKWGRLPSSTLCVKCKSSSVLVICPLPICDTRKKVKEPWHFLFVQMCDSWLNSFFFFFWSQRSSAHFIFIQSPSH